MLAVHRGHPIKHTRIAMAGRQQVERPIQAVLVEDPRGQGYGAATHQHRGGVKGVIPDQVIKAKPTAPRRWADLPGGRPQARAAAAERQLWRCRQHGELQRQLVGIAPPVIAFQKGHVGSARCRQQPRKVAVESQGPLGAGPDADALGVLPCGDRDDLRGAIPRVVIADQQLKPRPEGLGLNRSDGLADERRMVARQHQHRDLRTFSHQIGRRSDVQREARAAPTDPQSKR